MRKIALLCLALLFSGNLLAESCASKLTYGQDLDSKSYSLNMDNMDIEVNEDDYLQTSYDIIRDLAKMRKCARSDVNFKKTPSGITAQARCIEAIPGNDMTRVCYVESNIGYFFLTWDMQTTVHVVFNRWD